MFEKSCRGSSFKADRIRHLPEHGKQFPFRRGGGSLPEISRGNSSVFDSNKKKKKRKGKKMVIPDEQVDGKVKWDAWNRGEWLLKPLSSKPRIDVIEVSTINPSI